MNAPDINRSILRMHIAAIEAKHPIKIIGMLPQRQRRPCISTRMMRSNCLAEKRTRFIAAGTLRG